MMNLTWEELYALDTPTIKNFIRAYATYKEFTMLESFFEKHTIEEQRDTLAEYTIELLGENRPSTIHAETSDRFINDMEPLAAYFEYYLAYVSESEEKEASRAMVQSVDMVKKYLCQHRDNLKHYSNDALFTDADDGTSSFTMDDDAIYENMTNMRSLKWDDIFNMSGDKIRNYLTAYSITYEYPISETFFAETMLDDQRETLATYTIELHTKEESSYITARTTDEDIENMDPVWAYFEYYHIYLVENASADVAMVLFLEIDDVKSELKSARDQLCMKRTHDEMEDDSDNASDGSNDAPVEVYLFDPEKSGDLSIEEKQLHDMYIDTISYHKMHNVIEFVIDKDMCSLIGVLPSENIDKLSQQALCTMLRSYDRLEGDTHTFEYYVECNIENLRDKLQLANKSINEFRNYRGRTVALNMNGMNKQDVKGLSLEQKQVILYNHYRDSDCEFRNTFGNNNKNLGDEIERIIRQRAVNTMTKVKKSNLETRHEKPDEDSEKLKNDSAKGEKTQGLKVTKDTNDSDIDNATMDDMRSEYFKIVSAHDPKCTLISIFSLKEDALRKDLKKARDELVNKYESSLNEFYLTGTTTDETIAKLNNAQCLYVIRKFCERNNVRPDNKYLSNLTREKMVMEVLSARDEMKKLTQKRGTQASMKNMNTNMEYVSVEKQDTTQQLDNNKTTQKTDMNEKLLELTIQLLLRKMPIIQIKLILPLLKHKAHEIMQIRLRKTNHRHMDPHESN